MLSNTIIHAYMQILWSKILSKKVCKIETISLSSSIIYIRGKGHAIFMIISCIFFRKSLSLRSFYIARPHSLLGIFYYVKILTKKKDPPMCIYKAIRNGLGQKQQFCIPFDYICQEEKRYFFFFVKCWNGVLTSIYRLHIIPKLCGIHSKQIIIPRRVAPLTIQSVFLLFFP